MVSPEEFQDLLKSRGGSIPQRHPAPMMLPGLEDTAAPLAPEARSGFVLRLELPFVPPSVNGLFHSVQDQVTGKPRRVLTAKARKLRAEIAGCWKAQGLGALSDGVAYELRLWFFMPVLNADGTIKKLDTTNRVKFLEDCIAANAGIDDRLFFRVVLEKVQSETRRTEVQVWRW